MGQLRIIRNGIAYVINFTFILSATVSHRCTISAKHSTASNSREQSVKSKFRR